MGVSSFDAHPRSLFRCLWYLNPRHFAQTLLNLCESGILCSYVSTTAQLSFLPYGTVGTVALGTVGTVLKLFNANALATK